VDTGAGEPIEVVAVVEVRDERRVSWRPGAEGAPFVVVDEVFVVEVE
jgi:hypothetical protein